MGEPRVGQLGSAICPLTKERRCISQIICPFLSRRVGPLGIRSFFFQKEDCCQKNRSHHSPFHHGVVAKALGLQPDLSTPSPSCCHFRQDSSLSLRPLSCSMRTKLCTQSFYSVKILLCEGYRNNKNARDYCYYLSLASGTGYCWSSVYLCLRQFNLYASEREGHCLMFKLKSCVQPTQVFRQSSCLPPASPE